MEQMYTTQNAERLGAQISLGDAVTRQRLQPEFNRILTRLKAEGIHVPKHLCELNDQLTEEAVEACFDNLPV
jgi:hypothetical protein